MSACALAGLPRERQHERTAQWRIGREAARDEHGLLATREPGVTAQMLHAARERLQGLDQVAKGRRVERPSPDRRITPQTDHSGDGTEAPPDGHDKARDDPARTAGSHGVKPRVGATRLPAP